MCGDNNRMVAWRILGSSIGAAVVQAVIATKFVGVMQSDSCLLRLCYVRVLAKGLADEWSDLLRWCDDNHQSERY